MEAIETDKDIYENIAQVERYLACEEGEKLQVEMIGLIQRGRNFVSYKTGNRWHFIPSKYIGYKKNNLKIHKINIEKKEITGRETGGFISKVLKIKQQPDTELECEYQSFCLQLGIPVTEIYKHPRKFWRLEDVPEEYLKSITECRGEYTEGNIKEIRHKRRERNSRLVQDAKIEFKAKHNEKLFCEICGFDFSERYGDAGYDFIEAHHTKPISEMDEEGEIADINDLIMVCSNCHSIIHRRNPFYTIEEMKNIINLNS